MAKERIMLEIILDLDPVPGTFHTKESARDQVEAILLSMIRHYNPVVLTPK